MRRIVGLRQMPATGADFFLVDRRVIDAVRQFREQHVSVFALLAWVGFRQETIDYEKQPRAAGQSGWSLRKKINLVSDSVTAFSDAPLRAGAAAGLGLVAIAAGLLLAALLAPGLGPFTPGWLLVSASIFAVGGINLLIERRLGAADRLAAMPESGQTAVE
jgi:dolichol-phosphate mannosyltransferase